MRQRLIVILIAMFASGAYAGDSDFKDEVSHLLDFIEHSDCTFIRNGKRYNPVDARAHIERKFNHIEKRISTTEQFIRYGASKSSITGRPYQVECGTVSIPAAQWLEEELVRDREGRATSGQSSAQVVPDRSGD